MGALSVRIGFFASDTSIGLGDAAVGLARRRGARRVRAAIIHEFGDHDRLKGTHTTDPPPSDRPGLGPESPLSRAAASQIV
ncbi:MAG TPA: hypothetical protein VGF91_02205 [Solirubrobacteraceae bacterium]